MEREVDIADGIDFRRRYRRIGHSQVHIGLPAPSRYNWAETLMLIIAGLIGGFGLGLAFAMLTFMNVL